MKRVLSLVLAVVFVAAVLAPVAAAKAAQNATTVTALKEAYSHIQTSLLKILHACISNSASTPTKSTRASRTTTTTSPPLCATTGMSSTGIGGSRYDDQVCRYRDYVV